MVGGAMHAFSVAAAREAAAREAAMEDAAREAAARAAAARAAARAARTVRYAGDGVVENSAADSTLTTTAQVLGPDDPMVMSDAVTNSIPVRLVTNPDSTVVQLEYDLDHPLGTAKNQAKFATEDSAEFDDDVAFDAGGE